MENVSSIEQEKENELVLVNMTEEEAEEYITSLATTQKVTSLQGLEAEVEKKLRELAQKFGYTMAQIEKTKTELNKLFKTIQELQIQMDVYGNILLSAEDARRGNKKEN